MEWTYHLQGPDAVGGKMTLLQQETTRGLTLSSTSEIQKGGLGASSTANSSLVIRKDGSALAYEQKSFVDGKLVRNLHLSVDGRKISGMLEGNGKSEPLHYNIFGPVPHVYIIGNNLLNGFQALLYT